MTAWRCLRKAKRTILQSLVLNPTLRVAPTARTAHRTRGPGRPRVLHLAYEDHAMPGAAGGAARTRQINERLADRFDITEVCARYRGARTRKENGIRYRFIGIPFGRSGTESTPKGVQRYIPVLSYFFCLPFALFRYRSDIVVEDFTAPFASIGAPFMTRRPVVGVAQWLWAQEIASRYRPIFCWVENLGLSSHRELIAPSAGLADELLHRNPRARVHVVGSGVDQSPDKSGPSAPGPSSRSDMLFLGRLDYRPKGLDLLLDAYATIAPRVEENLLIAGDGPDRHRLQRHCSRLGVSERVKFLGWIPRTERMSLLAHAEFVVMPSRYETFGMVAAEALSVSTPVIAFDIPCLRELVTADNGLLVHEFKADDLAAAMLTLATDPPLRRRLGSRGPQAVALLSWDRLARQQGDIYAAALQRYRRRRERGHHGQRIHRGPWQPRQILRYPFSAFRHSSRT